MATLAEDNGGTQIDGEPIPEINYEAEARKIGWKSLDELGNKVDPNHFVDAETFYKRGQDMMPVLRANNSMLSRKIDALERQLKQVGSFVTRAEERGYERALADIEAKQEAAVESGDLKAFREASQEADKLRQDMAKSSQTTPPEDFAADFTAWGKENKWYVTNSVMAAYADNIAVKESERLGRALNRSELDELTSRVKEEFSEDFPEAFERPAPRQKRPMVDGGGQRQPVRGGKTYNDLPADAKAMCDKWTKQGLMTKEDYVKNYQWS